METSLIGGFYWLNGHYRHADSSLFMDSENSGIDQYEKLKKLFHRVCFKISCSELKKLQGGI